MTRKRQGKNNAQRHNTDRKISKGNEIQTSAAKPKKGITTPNKETPRSKLVSETDNTKTETLSKQIVWREPQYNDMRHEPEVELGSSFQFRDAGTSPKSRICELQINTIFDNSLRVLGEDVEAMLTTTENNRPSTRSIKGDGSCMSSFTSYSSLDEGYQITHQPSGKSSTSMSKNRYFYETTKGSLNKYSAKLVKEKIESVLNLCENRDSSSPLLLDTMYERHNWPLVPQCCRQRLNEDEQRSREDTLEYISSLGLKVM